MHSLPDPIPPRIVYDDEQKRLVLERYRYCVTRAEKLELAQQLGMESIEQLYNLANRIGATRNQQERAGGDGQEGAFAAARLALREQPESVAFSAADDSYLRAHFGRMHLEEIAFHRGHTETAMMVRARELGLRRFCKYWPAEKVVAWLGGDEQALRSAGLDVYDCKDRAGRPAIRLASTSSLLRLSQQPRRRAWLEQQDADRFLLRELDELAAAWQDGYVPWEASRWVSHGHTCLNPWAGVSFGLFDDGSDAKMRGRELYPHDIV